MKWNWHFAGYGLAALIVLGLLVAYHNATLDKVRSDAVQAAQATYQKQLTQQMADVQKQMADRDAAYQQQVQSLQTKLQQAATPNQIATLAAQVMGLRQPIEIKTPPATAQQPNPQPVAVVSTEDAPRVKAYISDCETCKLELPKAKADLADRQAQMALAQKQIDSLKVERDAAVKASKGGSAFQRFTRAAKFIIIGGGIGYVLGHKF